MRYFARHREQFDPPDDKFIFLIADQCRITLAAQGGIA
jgi:hypothetical protein